MAEDDKEAQMMEAMGLPVKFCSNSKKAEILKAEALAPQYWCEVCELVLSVVKCTWRQGACREAGAVILSSSCHLICMLGGKLFVMR